MFDFKYISKLIDNFIQCFSEKNRLKFSILSGFYKGELEFFEIQFENPF